jgi:hypothetical protein
MDRGAARLTTATPPLEMVRGPFAGQDAVNWRHAMTYRIVALSAIMWVAIWVAPYIYAVHDLIAWH